MNDAMRRIWFWQRIVSPHMAGLATALAENGCEVVYVAEQAMSDDRARQGWTAPQLGRARLELAPTVADVQRLVDSAPVDSVHICQGIRANGVVGEAQRALSMRGLRQWVVMETVNDAGWRGIAKRLAYRRLFTRAEAWLDGVLATGHRTLDWVVARGVAAHKVFPFAYFLPDEVHSPVAVSDSQRLFRFIFVGQFIELKRLDLLISALEGLKRDDVELTVIGSGPEEDQLRRLATEALPGRVRWLGKMPMGEVRTEMSKADCLVLPSRHDGWGAVVSEALMVGTPVICSDSCGSAGVVRASGVGGVFRSGSRAELMALLDEAVIGRKRGARDRAALAEWGRTLGAKAGAAYLQAVLAHVDGREARPEPPWCRENG